MTIAQPETFAPGWRTRTRIRFAEPMNNEAQPRHRRPGPTERPTGASNAPGARPSLPVPRIGRGLSGVANPRDDSHIPESPGVINCVDVESDEKGGYIQTFAMRIPPKEAAQVRDAD